MASATDHPRVLLGFAVQPVVAAAAGFALFPLLDAAHPGRTFNPFQAALVLAVFVGIAAALITGLVAYPLFRWLQTRGRVTPARAILTGALLGHLPSAIALLAVAAGSVRRTGLLPDSAVLLTGAWPGALYGPAVGTIAAAAFWWIARPAFRQPPGRDGTRHVERARNKI